MKTSALRFARTIALFALATAFASDLRSQTLTTIYRFTGGTDGSDPQKGLVQGSDGNFYGTSFGGFNGNVGTVFKVTSGGALTTLYRFTNVPDGASPHAELVQASNGNLYGTTRGGGTSDSWGAVFKVTTGGAETVLYRFTGDLDGGAPQTALIQANDGNLYGTTSEKGTAGGGTIYKITPAGTFSTFYRFDGSAAGDGNDDAAVPEAKLVQGKDGNLYGTSAVGGGNYVGSVFRITLAGAETVLYRFSGGSDGATPKGPLIQGTDGNFYGTTYSGGANDYGTIFKITPAGQLTTIHSFDGSTEGAYPYAGLVQASDGNFYGTAGYLGANGFGTVYKMTPDGTVTTIYSFNGGDDGSTPYCELVQGKDGDLYGTTSGSADDSYGTIFRVSLGGGTSHAAFFTGETALSSGVYYLQFVGGNPFGYYSYLTDQNYVYHFDLGYEYVFDAADGKSGVYLYDFKSNGFFYTSPTFPFPYLYDFTLNTVLYYYPDPSNPGHYNTNGYRFFYRFDNGQIITK